jgi:hypothetical protein
LTLLISLRLYVTKLFLAFSNQLLDFCRILAKTDDTGRQSDKYKGAWMTIETGLFEIQADHLQNYWENRQLLSDSRDVIHTLFRRAEPDPKMKDYKTVEFARCLLRLANLPNFALDRLSRYEATL